jgi:hypothetical protein
MLSPRLILVDSSLITASGTAPVPAPKGAGPTAELGRGTSPEQCPGILVPAPKGLQQTSPGQRPGIPAVPIGRALKGRDRPRHLAPALAQESSLSAGERTACAALSGQESSRAPALPERCPGLMCCGPFGAGSRTRGGGCVFMPGVPGPGDHANLCLDEWVSERMKQLRDEAAALEPQGVA